MKLRSLPLSARGNSPAGIDSAALKAGIMHVHEQADELPSEHEDRRTCPRFALEEPSAIVVLNQGIGFRCNVLDLSISGCRLRTGSRFPGSAWDCVEISFQLGGVALRINGEIQWIDGRQKAGIRFMNLTMRRREELAKVLAEANAQNAALAAVEAKTSG